MSWKNGLLLSAVSYVFYLVMWFILDDKTIDQLPGMTIADYMVDFLLCMLFTYISLGFCFLVFRVLPFRTSYVWGMVYASCLMALNKYRCVRYDNLVQFPMGRNRQRASRRTPQHERRIHLCHDIYLPVKRLCQLLLPSVLHQGARRETSTRNGADEGKRDRLAVATQLAETANQPALHVQQLQQPAGTD